MLQLVHGQTLEWWGFTNEALAAYRTALVIAPGAPRAIPGRGSLVTANRGHQRATAGL